MAKDLSAAVRMASASDFEDQRRHDAYFSHANDRDAAASLGISADEFAQWRMAHGKLEKGQTWFDDDTPRFLYAYLNSTDDADASQRLNTTRQRVQSWRKRMGLPRNRPHGRALIQPSAQAITEEIQSWTWTQHAQHLGCTQLHLVGCTAEEFLSWQMAQKPLSAANVNNRDMAAAYLTQATDDAAATLLGISASQFAQWRQEQHLQKKGSNGV